MVFRRSRLYFKRENKILTISWLSRQGVSNHVLPWKVKVKIWPLVEVGQGHLVTQVGHIHHSMYLAEKNAMTLIPRPLSHLDIKLLAKKTIGDLEWSRWPLEGSQTKQKILEVLVSAHSLIARRHCWTSYLRACVGVRCRLLFELWLSFSHRMWPEASLYALTGRVCVCVCVFVCASVSSHRDYWPHCFKYFMTKDTE